MQHAQIQHFVTSAMHGLGAMANAINIAMPFHLLSLAH